MGKRGASVLAFPEEQSGGEVHGQCPQSFYWAMGENIFYCFYLKFLYFLFFFYVSSITFPQAYKVKGKPNFGYLPS